MGVRLSLGLACLLLAASPALAQETTGDTAAVVSYPPAFFDQYKPTSALNMVFNVPGFGADFGADARGYSGNAGNILIDGDRPPDDLRAVLDRIPASAVERIDIVRGGAGGIDMHGKTVIANVIRKKDTNGKASGTMVVNGGVDARDGWNGNTSYQIQRSRNGRTTDASLEVNRFKDTDDGLNMRRDLSGVLIRQSVSKGVAQGKNPVVTGSFETPWAGGKLRVNGRLSHDEFSYDSVTRLVIPGGVDVSGNANTSWSGELGVQYSHALPRGASGEVVFVQKLSDGPSSSYYNTPAFTSGTIEQSGSMESVLSGSVTLPKRGPWSAEFGSELAYNRQDNDTAFSLNGSGFSIAGDSSVVEELRSETFAAVTWRPNDKFSIVARARYERSTITATGTSGGGEQTLAYLKPNLNITWSPNKDNIFTVSAERVVDQLSFGGFAASASFDTGIFGIGNPDLKPESTWITEARYEHRFDSRGSFAITLRQRDTSDVLNRVIVEVPNPQFDPGQPEGPANPATLPYEITRNVGTAVRHVAIINLTLPLDRFGFKGATFTARNLWRKSSTLDPITNLERRLNGEPPVEWNYELNQQIQNSKYSWSLYANNGASFTNYSPRTISTNSFIPRVGAAFSYKPRPEITWTIGVNNILQPENRSTFTLYNAPRNAGTILYREEGRGLSARSVFVTLRRSF